MGAPKRTWGPAFDLEGPPPDDLPFFDRAPLCGRYCAWTLVSAPVPPLQFLRPLLGATCAERAKEWEVFEHPSKRQRWLFPDSKAGCIYSAWHSTIRETEDDLLGYLCGERHAHVCRCLTCPERQAQSVKLVGMEGCTSVKIFHCEHGTVNRQLIRHGYHPSAPSRPGYAFFIKYLDFYNFQFEHSCESVQAAAAALTNSLRDNGLFLRNSRTVSHFRPELSKFDSLSQGCISHEGYHRPLQYAMQWYDVAHQRLNVRLDARFLRTPGSTETLFKQQLLRAVGAPRR